MKIKLLLIPVTMMSYLLSGCEKTGEFINIGEYVNMTNEEGSGYFRIGEEYMRDYECVVQNIFKKYVNDDLTKENNFYYPEEESEYVSFEISGEYKNYSFFAIDVFSTGHINTMCTGTRKPQNTTYLIDKQIAESIVKETKDRYDEINTIINEYEQNAINEHNIDKFFEAAEALENKTFTFDDITYGNNETIVSSKTYTITDADGSLTSEMKDIGYNYMPLNHSKRKDYSIEYKINDGWYLRIFSSYYYVACVYYTYSNPFYETTVQMDYNINDHEMRTKTDAFIDKIKQLAA